MSIDSTTKPANHRRAGEFRRSVALALRVHGIEAVETRSRGRRAPNEPSDVTAPELENFVVATAVVRGGAVASAVDEAEALARIAKRPHAVVVHRRAGDPARAHVAMSLSAFARIVEELHERRETAGRLLRATASTPPGLR